MLKELADRTIAGDDEPVATMDRPRFAPMSRVIAAALATELEVAELWKYDEDPRFVVQSAAAKSLMGKPGARSGVTARQAADLLFGVLSPALYLVFVEERGWSPKRFEDWAYRTLRDQLCQ